MKCHIHARRWSAVTALAIVAVIICVGIGEFITRPVPGSAEAILHQADKMAWVNNWIGAEPLFEKAERMFRAKGDSAHALYARVSEMPAHMESRPLPALISETNSYLALPAAKNDKVRLRILTIEGMLELEYDAAMAKATWSEVERLAEKQHEFRLASRASGEQGILAFLLGNVGEAKKRVERAYLVAKLLRDHAAQVRYAELIGSGFVAMGRNQESLRWLNNAISTAASHPEIAQPMIAYKAKTEALAGLGRYPEALRVIDHALAETRVRGLRESVCSELAAKGAVFEKEGEWSRAAACYREAIGSIKGLRYWRGLSNVSGVLAGAYEHKGRLKDALVTINAAISANRQTPDELYLVPRNLAIKAEIEAKLGDGKQAELLYKKGEDVLDAMLGKVPTPMTERLLLGELSNLYAGYFKLLSGDGDLSGAFHVIEQAHGRLETQALEYNRIEKPHVQTPAERKLNALELQLLDTDDTAGRHKILDAIYNTESELQPDWVPMRENPVSLRALQQELRPGELLIEYVLSEPQSFALAVTNRSVSRYSLPVKKAIADDVDKYRRTLHNRKVNQALGRKLFEELLGRINGYRSAKTLIVVPDGDLNRLPFSALVDASGRYLIASISVMSVPSGTVLDLLRTRSTPERDPIPYLGVAAWIQKGHRRPWIVRSITGPERSQLVPLPESKKEVETIASLMPKPDTILLGAQAAKSHFLRLPLARYQVLHLSLHAYANLEFPARSALVFASNRAANDDGLLQARDIRKLRLNARLVTLSACNTAVGPIIGDGTSNLVLAFIQAGAQSVVSTLWEIEDSSTARLMTAFYRRLAHGEGRAESLRKAQLKLLRSGLPPYYWASFQISGDAAGPLLPRKTQANGLRASEVESR